jgi:hypothetical protein
MLSEYPASEVAALEQRIVELTEQLVRARNIVQEWTDANSLLARSAAEARAKNQGMGRGFLGAVLGTKVRSVVRTAAAASYAAIAKEVAGKRTQIATGKRGAQELVSRLKEELAATKQELRAVTSAVQIQSRTKSPVVKSVASSLDLLKMLKEAHQAGLLTNDEFEEKRKKLVSEL